MVAMGLYAALGVRRVINACGIYSDLGGSVLSGAALAAFEEANATWASMDELLARSGERLAALCGCEAARVVPGASAGIALAVAACVARGDGAVSQALPACDAVVLVQRSHADYKYARCATLAGARLAWVDDVAAALDGAAAVLHPAHLDDRGAPLAAFREAAAAAGVPVVVDAAFAIDAFGRWSTAGDVACFSAKYFGGPNAGGFVAGRSAVVGDVAALDFTGYESGRWRHFGRAFKLDRGTVAATVAAFEAFDAAAWRARCAALASALAARVPGAVQRTFTLDERLLDAAGNAVVLRGAGGLVEPLAAGDPSVRALAIDGDLVLCTDALDGVDELASALERARELVH
jgi:L-seryl-tRNA(Ser) seleniumtransferase